MTTYSSYSTQVSTTTSGRTLFSADAAPAWRLFLLNPVTALAARVNQSTFTYPLDEVTFDTVTEGSTGQVDVDMTVLFGSSAGADDLGRQRTRDFPTSSVLYIGRSSQGTRDGEVNLADNMYVTVLQDYRVWSKTPYIDPDTGAIYKDSDVAYTNQNTQSPPVANGGPGFCGTIDNTTGVITVTLSSSNSFTTAPGATIASQTWDVQDGTITVGTSGSATITATFPAGFRWVSLIVADSNAKSHECHIPIFARDPDADDSISAFEIERHTITPQGQEISFKLHNDALATDYPDGTLAMLWYGEAASATDRTHMQFIGWHQTDPAEINAQSTGNQRETTLHCIDVAGRLKTLPGFSQILENVASPATWQEMTNPNMDRYLHYLLHWHSTALDMADWTWSATTTTYPFKVLASDGASLFDQVERRAAALVPTYHLTCNRRGQMYVKVDPMIQDSGSRTATVQATLTGADYTNISYTHQRPPRVHWLRSNALQASGSTVTALFSIAPGEAPGQGEGANSQGEQLAVDQTALNANTGHRYARMNAPQNLFDIDLAYGDDLGLEPANLTWLRLTIDTDRAAQRGLAFTNARGLLQEMNVAYRATRTGTTRSWRLRWERETVGIAGITVTPSVAEPVDTGNWNSPTTEPEQAGFNNGLEDGTEKVAALESNGYIYTTSNWTAGSPTWSRNTAAASTAGFVSNSLVSACVDPFSPRYRGLGTTVRAFVLSTTKLWRLDDIFGVAGGPTYVELHEFDDGANRTSGEYGIVHASFGRYFADEADNPWLVVARSHRTASDQNGVFVSYSMDAGATWSSEVEVSGFNDSEVSNQPFRIPLLYASPRTPGLCYVGAYSADGDPTTAEIYESTDWGATWAINSSLSADLDQGLGYSIHIPWQDNAGQGVAYYTKFNRDSNIFTYNLMRNATDISPTSGGKTFAPFRGLFGIRALDSNRQYMVMIGAGDGVSDAGNPDAGSTDANIGIFVSSNAGTSWTLRGSLFDASSDDTVPLQAAFSATDPNILYLWGQNGYLSYSVDNGATISSKKPGGGIAPTLEMLMIAGGGS